jgi:ABC-type transport system involved in cytochrome c biogenesis permease subunit
MFRSRVTVRDASGAERAAVIEMNRPLSHGGYQFFQSSYQISEGREMSVLQVSKDPGQVFVFWGYGLLVLGMIVVLVTRIAQSRGAGQAPGPGRIGLVVPPARGSGGAPLRALLLTAGLLAALAAGTTAGVARAGQIPPPDLTEKIRRLPVQTDGRAMPFDTQAREAVRTVTGSPAWRGTDPVALAIGWIVDPQGWSDEPVVRINGEVAELVGLHAGARYASYHTLVSSQPLRDAVARAAERQQAERKPWPHDKHLLKVEERLIELDAFLHGHAIRAIPAADRVAAWEPPANVTSAVAWAGLEAQVRPTAPAHYPSAAAIQREIRYNALHPTRIAWFLLLPAAIAAGMTLGRDRWRLTWVAGIGTVLGFAIMTWGIAVRWQIAGRIPASNMYESMLFLGWGVGLFGVVSVLARNRMLIFNASAMSALVMFLLDRLPIDPFIHPMAPVLSGTPWLAIHVPIIMVSYSVFAIATFLAHLVVGVGIFAPASRARAERWSSLLYWYLIVGSILLIAGILTGSIWAASSWGRYWGWDPKEVWSLVAFIAYMAILHARIDGQIDSFGVAVSSIVAFWTILMTYLGVNFVLASGLHSYGFGSSNLVRVMAIIALVETAFLAVGWRAHRKRPPVPGRGPAR